MDKLAIVVPCYNEEEVLNTAADTLRGVLDDLIEKQKIAKDSFVLFVNDKDLMHFSYERYLENCIRKAVDFSGTPIKLVIKNKGENE